MCANVKGPIPIFALGPQFTKSAPGNSTCVGVDILGPFRVSEDGNRYVLIAMDNFTKWPEAYAIPDQTVATTAENPVAEMFCRFRVLDEIHSDQGRNFKAEVFHEVCQLLGIRKICTTPLHPQSDGLVECFNRTLTPQLVILTSDHQCGWDRHIPLVLWAYRMAVQESTGCTPAALMFGRELQTPVELVFGSPPKPEIPGVPGLEYLQKLQNRLHVVHEAARDRQEAASAKQKRAYDVHSNNRDFAAGDRVWVYSPKKKKGYSPKL